VDPRDPDAAVVCAFHEGLSRGVAEVASGENVGVRLLPFVAPGLCRVEISPSRAQTPDPRKGKVQADPNLGTEDDADAVRDAPRPRRTRRQP
jgi:hypothetical protein